MSISNFLQYEHYINLQNKQLEKWGQLCTVYHPDKKINLGYEDTNLSETNEMNVDGVLSTKYTKSQTKVWINFNIEKSVFYRFNWFPEDSDELCQAFFDSSSQVREGDYIRTAIPETTSIWGDMIFSVEKIKDKGLGQVLERIYFLRPTNNLDLQKELSF